jgi:hypothetical protein
MFGSGMLRNRVSRYGNRSTLNLGLLDRKVRSTLTGLFAHQLGTFIGGCSAISAENQIVRCVNRI